MAIQDYWDLTDRPHTERKLRILKQYLYPWANIIFNQWKKYGWDDYGTVYYIDCFAGRGKYHKDGRQDSVDGSPIIALKCAEYFQNKYKNAVKLRCIFVEEKKKNITDLKKFSHEFVKKGIEFRIYHNDVNKEIKSILDIIKSHASFFFIDPCRLKQLDCETVKMIVNKKGPNDIILNYICGTKRVIEWIKKRIATREKKETTIKLIESIAGFHTLDVLKESLEASDRDRLRLWAENVFKETALKYKALYEMISSSKNEPVYYLLFASRRPIAKKIMIHIFNKEDRTTYSGQQKLFSNNNFDF